jgi:hypothetical protein
LCVSELRGATQSAGRARTTRGAATLGSDARARGDETPGLNEPEHVVAQARTCPTRNAVPHVFKATFGCPACQPPRPENKGPRRRRAASLITRVVDNTETESRRNHALSKFGLQFFLKPC